MRGYQSACTTTTWTKGPEDVKMCRYKQARTNLSIPKWQDARIKESRIWGYKDTNKDTWAWECEDLWVWGYKEANTNLGIRHEDVRMRGYNQIHGNLSTWGYDDARMKASTHEPEDIRIWGCQDARMPTSTHEHEGMRMQGCWRYTGTWGYKKAWRWEYMRIFNV